MRKRRTFVRRFLCCIFHQHILVRLPGLEPGASGLGDMFVELPAMSSHILLCISTTPRLLSISPVVQYSQLSEPFITKVIVSKKLAAIFQTAN